MNINAQPDFRTAHPVQTDDEPYLVLTDLSGPLVLDAQFGVHPARVVPELAEAALLGDLGEWERLFAVVDAGKIPGLSDRLPGFDAPFVSLLAGAAEDELQDIAHYLVDVTDDPRLLRALFTDQGLDSDMGGRGAVMFVRASVTLDEMRRHMRRFNRARDQKGKWFYFRMWDPAVMFHYVDQDRPNLANLAYLFEPRYFDAFTMIIPHGDALRCVRRIRTVGMAPGHLTLTADEFDCLRMGPWITYVEAVYTTLKTDKMRPEGIDVTQIAGLCSEGFGSGIRIEQPLYYYVRARMRAQSTGADFNAAFDAVRAKGAMSQLDFVKNLERALGFEGPFS